MQPTEYLESLLIDQQIPSDLKDALIEERNKVERIIQRGSVYGGIQVYNAGSFAKGTIILDSFDLDIVVYFPLELPISSKDIQEHTFNILYQAGYNPQYKNVAIRCHRRFNQLDYPNFHIDVVPGRAIDENYEFAYLYSRDYEIRFRTSVYMHINVIRNTGRRDIMKLLKLWKSRQAINVQTFVLELLFLRFSDTNSAQTNSDLSDLLQECFTYITNTIIDIKLVDPANSQNVISNDLPEETKYQIREKAIEAKEAEIWEDVFE